ncbi:hypothetical protein AVEN_217290-1 [Araneus ventricosus]|uniref:Uncharacterized protein n=1 Tax=Araneus ventricosus TaxID=182803 RepID=A0A4Y2G2V6_ARAVE|nr:hypothetical protein AVEN_217290-1 [Araneus ventricosus]
MSKRALTSSLGYNNGGGCVTSLQRYYVPPSGGVGPWPDDGLLGLLPRYSSYCRGCHLVLQKLWQGGGNAVCGIRSRSKFQFFVSIKIWWVKRFAVSID